MQDIYRRFDLPLGKKREKKKKLVEKIDGHIVTKALYRNNPYTSSAFTSIKKKPPFVAINPLETILKVLGYYKSKTFFPKY